MLDTVFVSPVNPKLHNILERCDFLELTSSDQALPNSKGKGLPLLKIQTSAFSALVALQGAQLLQFCATGGAPLLWLSPNCDFTPGVALRGGIPLCLPWFGPHPTDPSKPKHGYARNRDWQLSDALLLDDNSVELIFHFNSIANELFEFNFSAELVMVLGKNIRLEMEITNNDIYAFDFSWVFHSYHPVSSLTDVRVKGLAGKIYLDNLDKHAAKLQEKDVSFPAEIDRVYPAINNEVQISGRPAIGIKHHNCPSVVVWNPGASNAAKIADIGAGNEQHYICVERGAVLTERWTLEAGSTKMAYVEIKEL